jgi:hydrogenase expression/formation protein HypC
MCVGLPAKVEEIEDGMAVVDATGAKRKVSVELIDDLNPGDYVMIHAGIAIAKITSEEAQETKDVMEELYAEAK